MLTSKVFLRKTKRGNVLKIVREHYLRDDISCGSKICLKCSDLNYEEALLEAELPPSFSKAYINPHYLVVDTNIVLHQIDVLEADVLCNVIVTQTVLEEVKHRSSTIYKRLKDIINDRRRKFFVFVNEHHKDTYIEREPGETANDRNDRAIRTAAKWYDVHLSESQYNVSNTKKIRVVLLTDDADNRKKATDDGLLAASVEDYVCCLNDSKGLEDKISKVESHFNESSKELFPCHLTPVQIHDEIKAGTILQGSFQASRENFLEGHVNVEGFEKPILVQGFSGLNRAVNGDIVAVRLLPENEWSALSEIILENDQVDDEEEISEKVLKPDTIVEKTPTGKIVGIIRRKWRQYCGILQRNALENATRHIFVPAEKKIPKIRIETRQAATLMEQRIIVAIDSWSRYSRYPSGHFVRALGKIGDKETENEVLLLEHDVPHSRFSDKVLSYLPKLPWTITAEDVEKRTDLRHVNVCSVDPPGCTDIDDALHCFLLKNGNYEVGVHIADVSHFIRPGTALDEEAALRATTVYLVDKRIDMVPDLLSSNLCSLRGGEERFAFSCVWEVTPKAEIVDTRFHKSIIRSRAALTYEEAQLIIDDSKQQTPLAKSLRGLNKLAKILKKKRIENGALVLASPEIRFYIDSETHDPIEVQAKKIRETNSMVEEFMLLANISVAKKIFADFPEHAVLRRHPVPPPSNFEPLIKAANYLGFDMNTSSNKELAESLDKAVKDSNLYFNTMLRILATRCMLQAVYFSSGMVTTDDFYHYGLAVPIYTHFTSPIRRYADILVHRLLAASIGADVTYPDLLDKSKTNAVCNNLNYRNRMAQYAGRASVALHTHIFFREKVEDEEGYVLYVRKNALQILIPKYGFEGTLYLYPSKGVKTDVAFTYSEENHTQTYKDIVFHTFDPVTVQLTLDRSDVQREKLVFKLVKPNVPNFSVPSVNEKRQENAAQLERESGPSNFKGNAETSRGGTVVLQQMKRCSLLDAISSTAIGVQEHDDIRDAVRDLFTSSCGSDIKSDLNIQVRESGAIRVTFELSVSELTSPFFSRSIRKKLRVIEGETQTLIKIPRKRKLTTSLISISGANRKFVLQACDRMKKILAAEMTSGGGSHLKRLTHFISIPANVAHMQLAFRRFKAAVMEKCGQDRGICERLFQKDTKLHFTLAVFDLSDEARRRSAINALLECEKQIADRQESESKPILVRIRGVRCMNNNPSKTNVVYAPVMEDERLRSLVVQNILDTFQRAGLSPPAGDPENVLLHLTLMNSKFTKYAALAAKKAKLENDVRFEKNFDASNILREFQDFEFGEMEIRSVHLSQFTGVAANGYYASSHKITF